MPVSLVEGVRYFCRFTLGEYVRATIRRLTPSELPFVIVDTLQYSTRISQHAALVIASPVRECYKWEAVHVIEW